MSQQVTPHITPYTYQQGDIVKYSLTIPGGKLEGTGRIVGVATNPLPIMGAIFMVEDPENFPNSVYPYTTIPMQESALEYLCHIDDEYLLISSYDGVLYENVQTTSYGTDYKAAKAQLEELSGDGGAHQTVRILNHSGAI
jgi:hypothetical protein